MGAKPAARCDEPNGNAPNEVLNGRRVASETGAQFIRVAQVLSVNGQTRKLTARSDLVIDAWSLWFT